MKTKAAWIMPAWTEAEWLTFGVRIRTTRKLIDSFMRAWNTTRGLRPTHLNEFVMAHAHVSEAMCSMEMAVKRDCRDAVMTNFQVLYGTDPTCVWGKCGGGPRKPIPSLNRDEWSAMGQDVKAILGALQSIMAATLVKFGPSHRATKQIQLATRSVTRGASKLSDLCREQHPDWDEFMHVFYASKQLT
jgi:hypothetical protein